MVAGGWPHPSSSNLIHRAELPVVSIQPQPQLHQQPCIQSACCKRLRACACMQQVALAFTRRSRRAGAKRIPCECLAGACEQARAFCIDPLITRARPGRTQTAPIPKESCVSPSRARACRRHTWAAACCSSTPARTWHKLKKANQCVSTSSCVQVSTPRAPCHAVYGDVMLSWRRPAHATKGWIEFGVYKRTHKRTCSRPGSAAHTWDRHCSHHPALAFAGAPPRARRLLSRFDACTTCTCAHACLYTHAHAPARFYSTHTSWPHRGTCAERHARSHTEYAPRCCCVQQGARGAGHAMWGAAHGRAAHAMWGAAHGRSGTLATLKQPAKGPARRAGAYCMAWHGMDDLQQQPVCGHCSARTAHPEQNAKHSLLVRLARTAACAPQGWCACTIPAGGTPETHGPAASSCWCMLLHCQARRAGRMWVLHHTAPPCSEGKHSILIVPNTPARTRTLPPTTRPSLAARTRPPPPGRAAPCRRRSARPAASRC